MTARPAIPAGAILAAALGALTAVGCAIAAAQMHSANGPAPLIVLPLAGSYDAAARALPASRAGEAEALTREALSVRPTDAEAWTRLASLETRNGRISPEGVAALSNAYAVAPYQPGLIGYRIRVAFEVWSQLPPDLQADIEEEIRLAWPNPTLRRRLFAAASAVKDPQGRVQLGLKLFTLRLEALTARSEKKAAEQAAARPPG